MIEKQVYCMRKVGVPESVIQEALKKHGNDLKKLIEIEEQYANYNESTPEEIRFTNCKNPYKDCIYFDQDYLECRMEDNCKQDCIQYEVISHFYF